MKYNKQDEPKTAFIPENKYLYEAVSIKDNIPKKNGEYCVLTIVSGGPCMAYFTDGKWEEYWEETNERADITEQVTHWLKKVTPSSIPTDPFIEKHLEIIKQKTKDALIDQHIGKMWGDLSSASIKYFLETGTINGGFREQLLNLMDAWKKYKLDEPDSGVQKEEIKSEDLFKMAEKSFSKLPIGVQTFTKLSSFIQGYCASYVENVVNTPVSSAPPISQEDEK